jgi:glucose-6-phosphate isomerase
VQLFIGGPQNVYTNFSYSKDIQSNEMLAIIKSMQDTYIKHKLPFSTFELDSISPIELGRIMQFKMMEIMFTAKLLGVNAFDQPNVEEYKEKARGYLKSTP